MRKANLENRIFTNLTAISICDPTEKVKKGIYWKCICYCGKIKIVRSDHLTGGKIKSCGCLSGEYRKELIGQVFNKLTVIGLSKRNYGNDVYWVCKCECGKETTIRTDHLVGGKITSCGCNYIHTNSKEAQITSAKAAYRGYRDGNITFEYFYNMAQLNCFYCNAKPANTYNIFKYQKKSNANTIEIGTFFYNGLDRIDSSIGHNINNVVTCCKQCNYAKMNMSVEEFRQLTITLYTHLIVNKFSFKCLPLKGFNWAKISELEFNNWINNLYDNFIVKELSSLLLQKNQHFDYLEYSLNLPKQTRPFH